MNPDIPESLRAAIAERYEIRRLLGRGGMATVYLAHDRKHGREVAVKVLRPDLAASLGSDRFLAEIQIAARLTHPHILALHDSGEATGFLYYVMPYLEGGSLRQRLDPDRPLTLDQTLPIAAPVADALTYAHRMGILHRDIKPENILFSQGHPIVGDFGIAKAISTAGGANLTRTGFPLGTPGYMSPEQASGLTDLTPHTDVYSLAVVIYEMLIGDLPGRWPSEDAVRAGRFLEAPPRHRARLAEVDSRVERALIRSLAVREDQRTATPAELMDELRGGGDTSPRRRYSEGEVREIVKRASELEATRPTAGGSLTIGGVEALAAEVGIPSGLVRSAAGAVDVRAGRSKALEAPKLNRFLGGPTGILFERVVEGELPESEYLTMVEEIRRVMKTVGMVSQLGRSVSWTMGRDGGRRGRDVEISISVRAGRTRIMAQEALGPLIGAIYGGIGGGMGGGGMGPIMGIVVGGLNAPFLLPVIIPAWLLTTFATARTSYYYSTRRRMKTLEELVDRLAGLAGELISEHG